MTRVCHMTSVHRQGDERILHRECASLAAHGYDTWLVAPGESGTAAGVHILGVGTLPAFRPARMTLGAARVYRAAAELDAAVYHLHDPELLPWGLRLKRAGRRVIFDSHEFYALQLPARPYLPGPAGRAAGAAFGAYQRRALGALDGVVFPCTLDGGRNPFAGLCRRTALVGNTARLEEFCLRWDPDAPKRPRQVCYVGGLSEARGITQAVRAAHAAGAVLALAGTFSSPGYERRLRAMPEFACVRLMGRLDRTGVARLLQESAAGLCVLRDRGQYARLDAFPGKVYEYLSMALPVILSDSPFHREMADRYGLGLCVDPEDTAGLARAIRRVLDRPDQAREMGLRGRAAVTEQGWHWAAQEARLLALYRSVLYQKEGEP